jgi:adenylate kinase
MLVSHICDLSVTMSRSSPNIILTGTPGVGKTCHSEVLAEKTGLKHLSINQIVKERECHEGWDNDFQSWIVDEDKVCFGLDEVNIAGA